MISYKPFFKTLKNKDISRYQLINTYNISNGTLDSLRKNKSVTLNTIDDLCQILDCNVQDIVEIKKNK